MASHFPPLYKDELFYSVLARYHQRSGSDSCKETLRDLFGKSSNTAISDFTGDLSNLLKNIGSYNCKPIDIIRNHTLLPYFIPFITKKHCDKLINQMISGQNSVSVTLGLAASTVKNTNHFRFCSKCFEQEITVYGEAYWHRSHQLPGVFICHEHKENLFVSNIPYRNKTNKHDLMAIDEQIFEHRKEIVFPVSYLETLVFISEQSYRLLNEIDLTQDIHVLREFYKGILYGRGYITTTNRLRLKKLVPDFLNAFETGLLSCLDSDFGEHASDTWFIKLLRKHRVSCHPLRHLLLLKFMGKVMPSVTITKNESHLFGDSPWPCLNKVCASYKKLTIYSCDVTTDSKMKKLIGTFTCDSCNFTYSRKGPDLNEQDKYKAGRVKNFGEVWMNKLHELNTEGKHSIRSMASYLNVDSKTVKKYLEKKSSVKLQINISNHKNLKDKTMKAFLELRDSNPDLSRTELRLEAPNLYMWLYRNEKEWLFKNLPSSKSPKKPNKRINWNSRDEEYSFLIIKEAVNIFFEIPLKRVTKTTIAKRLDLLSKIENHINKLPISQNILEEVTETIEEFQIRRIRYFAAKLKEGNTPYNKSSIARAAGIKNEYIKNKIDLVLQEEAEVFS